MTNSLTPDQQVFYHDNEYEGILSPDFYLWASDFFAKEPHTHPTVGWRQDANYWPMTPHNSVTVWLAFRYPGTGVKNALTVNPHFKAYLARGVDRGKRNPVGTPSAEKLGRTNFEAVGLEEAGRS